MQLPAPAQLYLSRLLEWLLGEGVSKTVLRLKGFAPVAELGSQTSYPHTSAATSPMPVPLAASPSCSMHPAAVFPAAVDCHFSNPIDSCLVQFLYPLCLLLACCCLQLSLHSFYSTCMLCSIASALATASSRWQRPSAAAVGLCAVDSRRKPSASSSRCAAGGYWERNGRAGCDAAVAVAL